MGFGTCSIETDDLHPVRALAGRGEVHVGGSDVVVGIARRRTRAPIEGPQREDRCWIKQLPASAARYGFEPAEAFEPDRWLKDGDTVRFGGVTMGVRHCPGHAPDRLAIVGDVLFAGSIGRTDFPRGNHAALVRSITTRL